jgi:hypothetical protein
LGMTHWCNLSGSSKFADLLDHGYGLWTMVMRPFDRFALREPKIRKVFAQIKSCYLHRLRYEATRLRGYKRGKMSHAHISSRTKATLAQTSTSALRGPLNRLHNADAHGQNTYIYIQIQIQTIHSNKNQINTIYRSSPLSISPGLHFHINHCPCTAVVVLNTAECGTSTELHTE